ncbi:TetR/AcrR family transcriptional regulator [Streptomyces radicis]|uniref:TetR/AcrR family transcriptional regulator n=1 Tax=Streptomyces radicis TaxID=1750517 RepID=A0A3A9WWA0_9ACTN|nr:TetR/AcrR family transcriptional regulator [Streptomyces radicis]RKN10447.1 TetR/AcrR family transcriptional regulator [Streptomyces radicis]RKN24706.1 TetR/AcrR family transcriptional regulator [Streptomyces radicis]
MTEQDPATPPRRARRVDARRNEQRLLDAAATVFATSGVDAPIRTIAAEAGVGLGTIYRHFPTRTELVVAVYGHQVEACVDVGQRLLAEAASATSAASPFDALLVWVDRFVDFVITKHGLADALGSDDAGFQRLHAYFLDRLVPVCAELLAAAERSGQITPGVDAYELMRGIGNLCVGHETDARYDPRHMIGLLVRGLRVSGTGSPAPSSANP